MFAAIHREANVEIVIESDLLRCRPVRPVGSRSKGVRGVIVHQPIDERCERLPGKLLAVDPFDTKARPSDQVILKGGPVVNVDCDR